MYKVINLFTDLQDNDHKYQPGDIFPRQGLEVSDERIEELAGKDNKQGKPLIKKVEIKAQAKPAKKKAEKKTSAK